MYTFGATGILNALNAADGTMVWSRNAATDADAEVPDWGFASSPLVVDDVVIIAVAGALAAYDLASGEPRWSGPDGGYGYSSPHLFTIDGVVQILLMSGAGRGGCRSVHRAGAVPGDRGEDLEPPRAGRRHPAGSQQRGDGRVPDVARG